MNDDDNLIIHANIRGRFICQIACQVDSIRLDSTSVESHNQVAGVYIICITWNCANTVKRAEKDEIYFRFRTHWQLLIYEMARESEKITWCKCLEKWNDEVHGQGKWNTNEQKIRFLLFEDRAACFACQIVHMIKFCHVNRILFDHREVKSPPVFTFPLPTSLCLVLTNIQRV